MRKIKFRAWDRKTKEMIYDALEIGNIGLGDGSVVVDEKAQRGNELDWMQFTGLTDKLGKEIYEGDIVLMGDREKGVEIVYGNPFGQVTIRREYKKGKKVEEVFFHEQWEEKDLQIIGNIYEDSNLSLTP